MKAEIDMHVHTCYSDGDYLPDKVARDAKKAGLKGIIITDHEYFNPALFIKTIQQHGLLTISGTEISAGHQGYTLHILIYRIEDVASNGLADWVMNNWDMQNLRTQQMIEKYHQVGIKVTLDEVKEHLNLPGPFVHFYKVVECWGIKNGISFPEAKKQMQDIGISKPPFIPEMMPDAVKLIQFAKKHNGIPVLAHPCVLKDVDKEIDKKRLTATLEKIIDPLYEAGLVGLEAYYPQHSKLHIATLEKIAKKRNLLLTGGSDYHGHNKPKRPIGSNGVSVEFFKKFIS